jgi:hypothetical protein
MPFVGAAAGSGRAGVIISWTAATIIAGGCSLLRRDAT